MCPQQTGVYGCFVITSTHCKGQLVHHGCCINLPVFQQNAH
jgi:hypothetical protein